MKNLYLQDDKVGIIKNDGSIFTIYFNQNSGKVYYRFKIGTLSKVRHPGIYLGEDAYGIWYFLHNHFHYGKAYITTTADFIKGMPLYIYNEKGSNSPLKVVEIGLNEILRDESYKPISYNIDLSLIYQGGKNGSFAFAEGQALCVGAKVNVRWGK